MNSKWFDFPAAWILLILPVISGEPLCKHERLKHFNISTELQSDVLLPCNFDPTLLGLNKSANIAVVWSQINTTEHLLVEISLQGDVSSWDNKGGRIKYFSKPYESGNFVILLQKVQLYDLSLYQCALLNGTGCIIAYQEIQLGHTLDQSSLQLWITVGALAGVTVLLVLFTACLLHAKRRKNLTMIEVEVEGKSIENPIYETSCQTEAREEEVSDTPIYAIVKKGKK
ncbi:uncharacterized protein Hap1MRO34_026466 isoform 1-T1 [Clarias gariepinus]